MRYNKETIRKGVIMNPFAQVRKVPLYYSGVQSNAYSVQTYDLNAWAVNEGIESKNIEVKEVFFQQVPAITR